MSPPAELPEYFIRMLTERDDLVVDPFAGSCVTGEVCERTGRRWTCIELLQDYCQAAVGCFVRDPRETTKPTINPDDPSDYYRVPRLDILWNKGNGSRLREDGGKKRFLKPKNVSARTPPATKPGSRDRDEPIISAAAPANGRPPTEAGRRPPALSSAEANRS